MSLLVEGKRRAAENDHHDRAWLAWHVAALQRAKTIPTLKDVAGPRRTKQRQKRAMTADQMLTMAHLWTAAAPPKKGK